MLDAETNREEKGIKRRKKDSLDAPRDDDATFEEEEEIVEEEKTSENLRSEII